jgi:choline/glycine/proline betaine transport protein
MPDEVGEFIRARRRELGLTQQQVINDVLDRYEAHLSFLQYSNEHDLASVLTPPRPATGMVPRVEVEPEEADGADEEPKN